MKLEIPDAFIDGKDRTEQLTKLDNYFSLSQKIGNKTYRDAMEVAATYGCREYKRADWQRIPLASSECLTYSVADMLVREGLEADADTVARVSRCVRLAAGRYLSYS